jgi:coenzyme F420-0:L-glutamate ligase/coenzyme F420-1:gamma-L-glutamate ligase
MHSVQLIPIVGMPLVKPGDDLAKIILKCMETQDLNFEAGDVLVLAQKIVSKSEGRLVNLREVVPSVRALQVAEIVKKDPRHVEVILRQSNEVLWVSPNIFIVEERNGYVCANAGVDRSNIEQLSNSGSSLDNVAHENENITDEWLALLPLDSNVSAQRLRTAFKQASGIDMAVIINDTHGRPFRVGGVGVAIGAAGLQTIVDERGESDLFGYKLQATIVGAGDELASAASLVMGQASEATPVVLIRGYHYRPPTDIANDPGAAPLVRAREQDKFRYPANRQIV